MIYYGSAIPPLTSDLSLTQVVIITNNNRYNNKKIQTYV